MAVGLIGNQSEFASVLLSTVDELTVYVVNSRAAANDEPELDEPPADETDTDATEENED